VFLSGFSGVIKAVTLAVVEDIYYLCSAIPDGGGSEASSIFYKIGKRLGFMTVDQSQKVIKE
jgi:hypothetical protein